MASEPEFESDELERIYRYRALTSEYDWPTVEDIILHNRMYWPSPADFNDPMDCRPNLIFGRSDRARRDWVRQAIANNLGNQPRGERRRLEREMLRDGPDHHRARAIEGFSRWMSESAVCCFSTVPDNLLMWSHYADHHRGVCFIFQEAMEPKPFVAIGIRYQEERPEIDITSLRNEGPAAMRMAIGTKSVDWRYEREKRMIDYRGRPGVRSFDPSVLKGIVFGARAADDDRARVAELLEQRGGDFEVWSASLSETEFVLELTRDA